MTNEGTSEAFTTSHACETCVFSGAVNGAIVNLSEHRNILAEQSDQLWKSAQAAAETSNDPSYMATTVDANGNHILDETIGRVRSKDADVRVIDEALSTMDAVECAPLDTDTVGDRPCVKATRIIEVLRKLDALDQSSIPTQ